MSKEKIKKPETITGFTVKYCISLFLGWVFAGLLIGLVVALVSMLVTGDYSSLANSGGVVYAGLISSLIVFGGIYLGFANAAGRNLRKYYTDHLWVRVLAITYASGLAIAAISFLVALITPLVNAGVGIVDISDKVVLAQIVSSAVAFVILAKMIGYVLQFPKWCGRKLYIWCLTIISVAVIALFMIFPSSFARSAAKDQNIINDLSKISKAINRYADSNGNLPANLKTLGDGKLNRDISKYGYKIISEAEVGNSNATYQLCSDDFLTDTKTSGYWNGRSSDELQVHSEGYNCFDLSTYIYVSLYDSQPLNAEKSTTKSSGVNYFEE
ncbi:MAG: hypothetical protein LBL08_01825 [Candidatus Nomurabacteria bacterium]|jgi:hypothetical protein|nr:hypothetical protein [Candidatus Nomurabacteria bacterium]